MTLNLKILDIGCFIIVVLVFVGCGYWVFNLGNEQRKQIRQENEILSKELKDLNLAETNLQQLKEVFDGARQELKILNERIPEAGKFGVFLKQVDALMNEKNIQLISLQPFPTEKEKRYTKIPIRLIFEGTFVNIYDLLRQMETMHRMVIMEKMKITLLKSEDRCRVDLTASAFER